MSFFKQILYSKNGFVFDAHIGASSTADILTNILTVDKLSDWITKDFNLDALTITYDANGTTLSHDYGVAIVDFDTLVFRYNAILKDLTKRGIIKDEDILDLWGFDDDFPNKTIYGWNAGDLAVVLDFVKTIIDIKNHDGNVSF